MVNDAFNAILSILFSMRQVKFATVFKVTSLKIGSVNYVQKSCWLVVNVVGMVRNAWNVQEQILF